MTDAQFINQLISNKAYIEELSCKEVVITDDNNIVAGMTSGNAIQHSSLPSFVNKGDIRIWAGSLPQSGNLNETRFTVDSNGNMKLNGTAKNAYISFAPNNIMPIIKMVSPSGYLDEDWTKPNGDGVSFIQIDLGPYGDTLSITPEIFLKQGEHNYLNLSTNEIMLHSGIDDGLMRIFPTRIDGNNWNIGENSLNIGGVGQTEITLNNLPASDPKIPGQVYTDSNGFLKVSKG